MADNKFHYGFRPAGNVSSLDIRTYKVADAYQASLGGSVDLGVGDVVIKVSTGTVALCPGTEGTEGQPFGVVMYVARYYDGTHITSGQTIPGGSTGAGIHGRQSVVGILPLSNGQLWEVCVDDKTTATTRAAYELFVNENVQLVNSDSGSINGVPRAWPQLDISGHAVTAGHGWRIVEISGSKDNRSFAESNVKLIVEGNDTSGAGDAATKIAGI